MGTLGENCGDVSALGSSCVGISHKTCSGQRVLAAVAVMMMFVGQNATFAKDKEMIVRISEVQIDQNSRQEYIAILKEEAEASVRLEPGVTAIFPMYQKENPTEVRILEIYANRDAYELHLKTPHFQRYKTTTLMPAACVGVV